MEDESEGKLGSFERASSREEKLQNLTIRTDKADKAKIRFMKDLLKNIEEYPSHEQKLIRDTKNRLRPQILATIIITAGITLAGNIACVIIARKIKGILLASPAIFAVGLKAADFITSSLYRWRCEELLLKAKNVEENDKSLLLKEARIKIGPQI